MRIYVRVCVREIRKNDFIKSNFFQNGNSCFFVMELFFINFHREINFVLIGL